MRFSVFGMIASFCCLGSLHAATIASGFIEIDDGGEYANLLLSDGVKISGGFGFDSNNQLLGYCPNDFACTFNAPTTAFNIGNPQYPDFTYGVELSKIQITPALNGMNQVFAMPFTATGLVNGPQGYNPLPCSLPGQTGFSPCSEPISGSGIAQFVVNHHNSGGITGGYYTFDAALYTFSPEPSTFLLLAIPIGLAFWKRHRLA